MKSFPLFYVAILIGISMISRAQIPNPGFEEWTAEGEPEGWATSNAPEAGLVNIFKSDDSHLGSYAVRGEVVNFFGTPLGCVIQSGPGGEGFPISEQYFSLELFYKFTSVGGDKFSVNVALYKNGNPIAQGAVAIPTDAVTYTYLSVPLNYAELNVPDLAIIQISITGPVTGSDVHTGSVMHVDDLVFLSSTGIKQDSFQDLDGHCYPNPARDMINFKLDESTHGEFTVHIFDNNGKEMISTACRQVNGNSALPLSVANLPAGLYYYSVTGQDRRHNGKFCINR